MIQKFSEILVKLSKLPGWLRAVIIALVAVLSFFLTMTVSSCGQTVRVTVRDTDNGVSISTSQSKRDSSGTNIQINPTVNYSK